MAKPLKKFFKSERFQEFLSWAISGYLRFVFKTSRWRSIGFERADKLIPVSPAIVCFWHGRMAMIPFMQHWPQKKVVALISGHSDGAMLAKTFNRLAIDHTHGSSNRGGAKAFLKLMDVLKNQDVVGIIPDGPRGPAKKLNEGIIHLAKHSQAPILPLAYATSRFVDFNSWDKFRLPLPFSRGVFIYGVPETVPADADDTCIENYRLKFEKTLTELQDMADHELTKSQ